MPLFDFPVFKAPESTPKGFVDNPALLEQLLEPSFSNNLVSALRRYSSPSIDAFVFNANAYVAGRVDCTRCANCCKNLEADLTDAEITILSSQLICGEDEFRNRYTRCTDGAVHIAAKPCFLLKENRCTFYSIRPSACAGFPYLDIPNVKFRLRRLLALRAVCPIVYNVVNMMHQAEAAKQITA